MLRLLLCLVLLCPSVVSAQQWLKQSTAATIMVGPFLDETDGVTAETGLTIAQADIRLSKNGAAFAQTNNAAGATHDENGHYTIPLNTTDTNTLGRLRVAVAESGALPVWQDFMVVTANTYDSLVSGSASVTAAVGTGGITTTSFAAGAIDAAAIAASAIGASELATDALGAAELAADAVTEIGTGGAASASPPAPATAATIPIDSMRCVGFQQITSLSSATALTVPTGARAAVVYVESQSVRYREDGTSPTTTVGLVIAAGGTQTFGANIGSVKFIETTTSAKINVSYYK